MRVRIGKNMVLERIRTVVDGFFVLSWGKLRGSRKVPEIEREFFSIEQLQCCSTHCKICCAVSSAFAGGGFMEKLDKFFVRHSMFFGVVGLGFALRDLGVSWVATVGFAIAFISILSVMLTILIVVDSKKF